MTFHFRTIGLIGKPSAAIAETLSILYGYLTEHQLRVVVEASCTPFINRPLPEVCHISELGKQCDLAITVGGDGTFLSAARTLAQYDVPLIGVNLGRLGFLVDISPAELIVKLDEILSGHYISEKRYLIRARIMRDERVIHEQTAVNEVVIHRWITPSMIEIVTSINGVFLNSQRSDGLIISTPTGSTAYALSGGGPILHPSLKAIVLVPINPHTLTNRPIVIDDDSKLEIGFNQKEQINAQITCDDISIPDVLISDRIQIQKDPNPIRILHPKDYDFFDILRVKLNWSS
jgi:NAD+ kinase